MDNVLPRAFAGRTDLRSGVWNGRVAFERGRRYLLMAESGGGKSSLCAFIYGYRVDYTGRILFDGRDTGTLSTGEWCDIRRNRIAYLPQEMRLFPELTAYENVMLKNRLTACKTETEIRDMFVRAGIADKADSPIAKMSVGQQQRVAFIRTLCQPFDFVLLDEPVSHLDADNNRLLASMADAEARRCGAGIIVTSVGNNLSIEGMEVIRL